MGRSPEAKLVVVQHDVIRMTAFGGKVTIGKERTMDQIRGPVAFGVKTVFPNGLLAAILNNPIRLSQTPQHLLFRHRDAQAIL